MPSLNLRNPLRRDPNRPTLKQRAATLKATAARLIRKSKNGPNADADLCALVGPWEAACRLYDRRIEEQSALERAAVLHVSYPGEQPAGAGPDWQEWRRRCDRWREQTGVSAGEEASGEACLALGDIEDQIAALPARTLAGLQIKARVAERNSSIDVEWPEGLGDGLVADLLSLTGNLPAVPAAAQPAPSVSKPDPISALIEASPADEEVDWHNPPPGFMAFPAIEPTQFINIRYGIVAELERLRVIARAEYARREPYFRDSFTQGELETHLSARRDELRLSALDAAIADPEALRAADADLIALGHAFDAATVRDREANDALYAAEDRAEPHMPERPAALFLRVEDAPFCLRKLHCHPEALQGQPVTSSDIEWMTRCPAQHEVWIDAPPGSKGWNMMPGKVPQIVPWPEAQARIDEIFAAWTAWEDEKRRVMNEAGVFDARDTTDNTSDAAAALARQIAAHPAHTVEGMRAKLRVAAFYCVCDPDTPEGEGYPGEAAIRSLYRDTPGIEISTTPSDIRIEPEA